MTHKKRNTQNVSAQSKRATVEVRDDELRIPASDVVHGLARMEDHWAEDDGEIIAYANELYNCWPIEEMLEQLYETCPALKQEVDAAAAPEFINDFMSVFAGRLFLAGRESRARKTITRQAQNEPA